MIKSTSRSQAIRSKPKWQNAEKENPYKNFIKLFQKEYADKETKDYLSVTSDYLNKNSNFEALLGNFAHGNIIVSKNDVLSMSYVTADIPIEFKEIAVFSTSRIVVQS